MRFSQEVLDELAIEVHKAKESPNILKVARIQPVSNGGGFTVIHAYMTRFDDHAKVLDAVVIELAFFRLQVQVIFF